MLRVGVIGVGYLGRLHAQKMASFDDVVLESATPIRNGGRRSPRNSAHPSGRIPGSC
jgi:hypothetical protein